MEANCQTEEITVVDLIHNTENLGELFGALAKAQSMMPDAKTDSKNPFFKSKYADLASVVKASRKPLTENGLSVMQFIHEIKGKSFLFTRLGHTSGQWIDSFVRIRPIKEDIQSLGSYLTYLRRYSYAAIVGVVSSDEDDDGEKTMERKTVDRIVDFEKNKT
jgi:hypothetical protein